MKKLRTLKDLKQDTRNANSHTAKGKKLLEKSLKDLGAGRLEIEPKYVAVALQRMADMGLTPKLL